jgi:phosphatidylserine/phosphatidylglycerophosphate/cardiolipin synthase-like enzyme
MLCLVKFLFTLLILALVLGPFLMYRKRALPSGLRLSRPVAVNATDVELLIDSTRYNPSTEVREIQQEIFDAMLDQIRSARSCILLDFFLWNGWQGKVREEHRSLSTELAEALIECKRVRPDMNILVLTDPINRLYGRDEEGFFKAMMQAGIPIIFTDLTRLHESNPLYALPAKTFGRALSRWRWFRREAEFRRFSHPLDATQQDVGMAQYARLLFFKANHRKILVTDGEEGAWRTVVSSLNPADGSSAHSNMGLSITGDMALTIAEEELKVMEWSAENPNSVLESEKGLWRTTVAKIRAALDVAEGAPVDGDVLPVAEWLTEGAIRDRVLTMLDEAEKGDEVRIAMFYLSDRNIVQAIKDAALSGARIKLILDLNRDAFGRIKNGVPNRPVGYELMAFASEKEVDLVVRWAVTHGEQFHTKVMSITGSDEGDDAFICGSANWTRRNVGDLNMEGNIYLSGAENVVTFFNAYFEELWNNADGLECTAPYEQFAETGWVLWRKTWLYRLQEATGFCTF